MKIAHVITRLIVGGAQENTLLTCEGLAARGHDVTLMAGPETGPEGSLWPRAERGGYRLVRLECMRREVWPAWELRGVRELTMALRRGAFDVVHTHSSKAGILGRLAAHRAAVPRIVHTLHGMSFNRTQPRAVQLVYRNVERFATRWTDAFISVADAMTDQFVAAGVAPRDRFTTVRSGMDVSEFRPDPAWRGEVRREWGVPEDALVVGTVARLFRNKGYESIVRALPIVARSHPDVRFVWIGDGANRDEYISAMRAAGLDDRLVLTGLVPPGDIPRLLNGFDVLVHASRTEGLARVLVQAALTEIPLVSFDLDGAREVVLDDVTGYLAIDGDVQGLAERIVALLGDADLRRRCGRQGRARCLVPFDRATMVGEIERLYRALPPAPRARREDARHAGSMASR